jgi:hypothetical protein
LQPEKQRACQKAEWITAVSNARCVPPPGNS